MVTNITLANRVFIDENNIGAMICHTPKTLFKTVDSEENIVYKTEHNCLLVKTLDQLNKYFGDPFIDPAVYSDLIIAYDMINHGIPLYISSVYEMRDNVDGFKKILYNGFTEFYFKDSRHYDVVGYRLKSEIKFCQPLISKMELSHEDNILHLYVQLYYLDSPRKKDLKLLNQLDSTRLYKTLHFSYYVDEVTDADLIRDFDLNEMELQIIYDNDEKALVKELISRAENSTQILLTSLINSDKEDTGIVYTDDYWYNVHTSDYAYDFAQNETDSTALLAYLNSIESITNTSPEPIMLYMGRVLHSVNTTSADLNATLSSTLEPVSPDVQLGVYSVLLEKFDSDCNTYLFINTPDLSVSTILKVLSTSGQFSNIVRLPENYNCDVFFGCATDFIDNSLTNSQPRKTYYTAALLAFYNLMMLNSIYITNSYIDLNIANRCVKLVLSESSAAKLQSNRCNSIVTFDIGKPSAYGDRSLSMLPNLRYSHISRSFVRLRRLIREYLETRKFILNTVYNIDTSINYIKAHILDDFKTKGVLSDYTIDYYSRDKTVYIHIVLLFNSIADTISLDFTI